MARRYCEPVEVKAAPGRVPDEVGDVVGERLGPVPGQPEAFLWRGRLYVVRAVLGRWRERRAWWHEALDPPPGQRPGIAAAARERQVWRVEASPGRLAPSGVFDLVGDDLVVGEAPGAESRAGGPEAGVSAGVEPVPADRITADPTAVGGWELRRVLD